MHSRLIVLLGCKQISNQHRSLQQMLSAVRCIRVGAVLQVVAKFVSHRMGLCCSAALWGHPPDLMCACLVSCCWGLPGVAFTGLSVQSLARHLTPIEPEMHARGCMPGVLFPPPLSPTKARHGDLPLWMACVCLLSAELTRCSCSTFLEAAFAIVSVYARLYLCLTHPCQRC
jgi:hypothetical protein